ncbi:MAG: Asp23/Gls24 family envelope stress response protein [Oscillospiraceae bacterium]|nr:Asp23/Gls24 family envelope stress response protein [Oscillospiraceae bacterium]MBQ4311096.1 Asp23/Gls24 family envelope stress response protein [Oscillospiraceae bacterium]MBQ5417807.1 Asp23/Gls24 family envelope stress response protein [Oscillospiraceae bacterium]
MIAVDNYLGKIELSYNYIADLVRYASADCFGVAALNSEDRLHSFFRFLKNGAYNDNGVAVSVRNGKLYIAVHITVVYGTNISAVSGNAAQKIKYAVEEKTGLKIAKVTVFVDGIRS